MLHLFILNPVAGGGKQIVQLIAQIEQYFHQTGEPYKIEMTSHEGDATGIAKRYAESGQPMRIFACGGDGTLHETVNGVVGYNNVELGVFPCGTGNDYCATWGEREAFLDVENQVKGSAVPVDLIECDGIYSINQCSIGFDALVASRMSLIKHKPIIGGKMSYISALLLTFLGKLGSELHISLDGEEKYHGEFMFTIAAKGKYHGGGFKSAPMSEPSNGKLNFMMVRKVTHLQLLKLLPLYTKGEHLRYTDLVINDFGEQLRVRAKQPLPITLDGEIVYSEDFCANLVKSGVKFVVPASIAQKLEETHKTKVPARSVKS